MRSMRPGPSRSLLIAVALLPSLLAAQLLREKSPFGSSSACQAAAPYLVRIRFDPPPKGGEMGPLTACDSSGVTLGPYAGETALRVVPAGRIRDMAVSVKSGAGAAIWGGLLGGGAGLFFSLVRTRPCGPGICHGNDIFLSTSVGVVSGAGIGWFFGRGLTHWRVVYRAYPHDS